MSSSLSTVGSARPPTTGNSSTSSTSVAAAARHLAQLSDTDQVSLEEFLESCRATSLLAELEDEEELPEAGEDDDVGADGVEDDDDDDDEDDEDDEDEDEYDENFDDDFESNPGAMAGEGGRPGSHHHHHHHRRHHHHHHRRGHGSSSSSGRNGSGSLLLGSSSSAGISGGRRKAWDDDFVLKRKFSALIPAFDPRPGRTNVNQTSDFDVPPPGSSSEDEDAAPSSPAPPLPKELLVSAPTSTPSSLAPPPPPPPPPMRDDTTPPPPSHSSTATPSVSLSLRGPNLPGVPEVEIDLTDPDWTIFRAVQTVIQSSSLGSKAEKLRRLWEPTYVIVYRENNSGGVGAGDSVSRQQSAMDNNGEGGASAAAVATDMEESEFARWVVLIIFI